ncbi:rubrerythrin-like domain-containing protein [Salinirubrum litoreum]|uniref:Rubrerythrin-like domain-containing protein n=1 Tax=Salinirubrum litoreum TaxID=1126234 RepID=A0ABD5R8B4_9EURY
MRERSSYECRECSHRVASISYRAACPECGSDLQRARQYGT